MKDKLDTTFESGSDRLCTFLRLRASAAHFYRSAAHFSPPPPMGDCLAATSHPMPEHT